MQYLESKHLVHRYMIWHIRDINEKHIILIQIDKMIIRTSLTVETFVKSYMYIRMMTELTSFNY